MSIESARFEGYGPDGAAVIVDCLTDNRDRVVAELRHVFNNFGGNLGAPGSVAYLFKPVGRMIYPRTMDLERLAKIGFGAGAEDVNVTAAGAIEVLTDPAEFKAVCAQLVAAGYVPLRAELSERAAISVPLVGTAADSMLGLLAALRELDDVQSVHTNAEIPDTLLAQL